MTGQADNRDDASQRGLIRFKGLGYGTYTVTETREPAGYASYAKPTFTVTIDNAGTSIQYRGTGTVPNRPAGWTTTPSRSRTSRT